MDIKLENNEKTPVLKCPNCRKVITRLVMKRSGWCDVELPDLEGLKTKKDIEDFKKGEHNFDITSLCDIENDTTGDHEVYCHNCHEYIADGLDDAIAKLIKDFEEE